jgi:hypothetical protein
MQFAALTLQKQGNGPAMPRSANRERLDVTIGTSHVRQYNRPFIKPHDYIAGSEGLYWQKMLERILKRRELTLLHGAKFSEAFGQGGRRGSTMQADSAKPLQMLRDGCSWLTHFFVKVTL